MNENKNQKEAGIGPFLKKEIVKSLPIMSIIKIKHKHFRHKLEKDSL